MLNKPPLYKNLADIVHIRNHINFLLDTRSKAMLKNEKQLRDILVHIDKVFIDGIIALVDVKK